MASPPLPKEKAVEAVEAVNKVGGNISRAAELIGIARPTLEGRLRAAKLQGLAPEPRKLTTSTSTLYDDKGNMRLQWVKEDARQNELQAAMRAFLDELRQDKDTRAKPLSSPDKQPRDMLSAIVMGDAHFGMKAWQEETDGADFDLKIAEDELKAAVSYLVSTAPKAKYGLLVDVGDFMHVDNRKAMTPNGGNLLDVDTRYQKLCRIVVMTFRYCIGLMLKRFEKVRVIACPGNHNQDSAGWITLALSVYYENEPRVTIDTSPGAYFYHRFGNNLIGVTHGDRCKFADLIPIMATDRSKDWGETEHRHFLTGHIHHTKHQEFRGGFAESFNTLAPGDAWHAASGYRSKRQMQRLDFHAKHGIISRAICNVGMLDI